MRASSERCFFFFSSRRRHTRSKRDWSSDVCSSDLQCGGARGGAARRWRRDPRARGRAEDGGAADADTAPDVRSGDGRSEEHTSELQSRFDLVCRLLLEKKKGTPT